MKKTLFRAALLFTVAIGLPAGGCQRDKHVMSDAKSGQVTVCSQCYDQIRKARSSGGPRGGLATNRTISTHMCEECKDEMTIYSENGVMKVRCPKCAPEGVACDRCTPRTAAK